MRTLLVRSDRFILEPPSQRTFERAICRACGAASQFRGCISILVVVPLFTGSGGDLRSPVFCKVPSEDKLPSRGEGDEEQVASYGDVRSERESKETSLALILKENPNSEPLN